MRLALLIAIAIPSVAHADGPVSFEVTDHGDSVEIIAHNVEAKTTNVSSVRSRIEVPINGTPFAARMPSSDATVLFAEFDGHSLSIKTRLGYPEVKALAPFAKAQQIGADLHLTFPRHAAIEPPKSAVVEAPKPVAPNLEAAAIEPKIEAKIEPKVEAKIEPKVEPKIEKKPDLKQAQAALAAATTTANPAPPAAPAATTKTDAKPTATPIPPDHESTFGSPGLYGAGALLTLLACGYLMKKRKKDSVIPGTIDVVAQRSLGNKAKIMWLSAGGRELLVSVTHQNVRMLGQWSKSDREGMPRAATLGRNSFQQELAEEEAAPQPQPIQSSAVSGILKLRARTSTGTEQPLIGRAATLQRLPPMVNEDVATEDMEADLEWAQEILTASRAGLGGRR